jgi:hypothetical protein
MQPQIFDCSLQFPGTLCVYGSSQAGKSTLVLEIIRRRKEVFNYQNSESIYYVYTSWQSKFDIIKNEVPTIQFVASYTDVPVNLQNSIIVFDDHQLIFQTNAAARLYVTDIFQRKAHHNNLFCVCILQTIHNNKLRSLALNSTYQLYFPSIRDNLQIAFLNREYFPHHKNFLIDVVKTVLKTPHGFMLIDCNRNTCERFRVRNFIVPSEKSMVFIPTDDETD